MRVKTSCDDIIKYYFFKRLNNTAIAMIVHLKNKHQNSNRKHLKATVVFASIISTTQSTSLINLKVFS